MRFWKTDRLIPIRNQVWGAILNGNWAMSQNTIKVNYSKCVSSEEVLISFL